MAHLTKLTMYNIEDSNIALLGSDLEKHVREHAGDSEPAWLNAGKTLGTQVWRIEQFHVKPVEYKGDGALALYDGDSYIILNTYKKDPNSDVLSYDLHFWLGEETTQDEAGTAAYKTVELDDHLHGVPVQYREVQCYESSRFLSHFKEVRILHGGVRSGFRHVTEPPPLDVFVLYRISTHPHHGSVTLHQVTRHYHRTVVKYPSDVFVLDKGTKVFQYNPRLSAGKERFEAAQFVRTLIDSREGKDKPTLTVLDEGGRGAGVFLLELGEEDHSEPVSIDLDAAAKTPASDITPAKLFRLSDDSGSITFTPVEVERPSVNDLYTGDTFLVDATASKTAPTLYAWIGKGSSTSERKYAIQYGQRYLWQLAEKDRSLARVSVVRVGEGNEPQELLEVLR